MKFEIIFKGETTNVDVASECMKEALKAIKNIIPHKPSEVHIVVKYEKTKIKAI